MTKISKMAPEGAELREYDRGALRSAFVSLFWSVICDKKKRHAFSLKALSDSIGVNKSAPSRWFSGNRPNWTLNTISDIANVLNLDLTITATDRDTGQRFAPQGRIAVASEPIQMLWAQDWQNSQSIASNLLESGQTSEVSWAMNSRPQDQQDGNQGAFFAHQSALGRSARATNQLAGISGAD